MIMNVNLKLIPYHNFRKILRSDSSDSNHSSTFTVFFGVAFTTQKTEKKRQRIQESKQSERATLVRNLVLIC